MRRYPARQPRNPPLLCAYARERPLRVQSHKRRNSGISRIEEILGQSGSGLCVSFEVARARQDRPGGALAEKPFYVFLPTEVHFAGFCL